MNAEDYWEEHGEEALREARADIALREVMGEPVRGDGRELLEYQRGLAYEQVQLQAPKERVQEGVT